MPISFSSRLIKSPRIQGRGGGGEGEEKKYLKIIEVKNGMLLMVILVGNKGVVTDL